MGKKTGVRKHGPQANKTSSAMQQVTDPSPVVSLTTDKTTLDSTEDGLPAASNNIFQDRAAAETWMKARSISNDVLPEAELEPLQYDFHLMTGAEGSSEYAISSLLSNTAWHYIRSLGPLETPLRSLDPTCYEVRPVGSRIDDHGLFAAKTIPMGSIIVSERPSVIFPVAVPLSMLNMDKITVCRKLFEPLSSNTSESTQKSRSLTNIMELRNSWAEVSCPEEGAMRTNGMTITIGEVQHPNALGTQYSAIFPTVSRCNHDCAPNAVLRWNVRSLSISLHAVQDIHSDSEITIAYIDICGPTKKRLSLLETTYAFKCTCSYCSLSKNQIEKRDKRLKLIRDWLADPSYTFPTLLNRPIAQLNASVEGMSGILDIFNQDHLHALRLEHMRIIDTLVRTQGALGDEKGLMETLDRAIGVWEVDASWSPSACNRVAAYRKWKEDPQLFPLWQSVHSEVDN